MFFGSKRQRKETKLREVLLNNNESTEWVVKIKYFHAIIDEKLKFD